MRALVSIDDGFAEYGIHEPDCLVLTCSACGDLTDPGVPRRFLQEKASRHAQDVHDGDVDREGWA